MTPDRLLERAVAAGRDSRRIARRESLDAKDVAAMANSGGGVILLGSVPDVRAVPGEISDFEIRRVGDRFAVIVGEAPTPVVLDGVVWIRRGARTAPANTADLADALKRSVKHAIASALRPPELPADMPIRVVEDERAPAFRVVDYDRTHPYRQKEVLEMLRERLPGMTLNQFDIQAVRHVLHTDDNPDFSHKPVFGTRQYSAKFIDWMVEQARSDQQFFARARAEYIGQRAARG